jgi:hypothetical protein
MLPVIGTRLFFLIKNRYFDIEDLVTLPFLNGYWVFVQYLFEEDLGMKHMMRKHY